MEKFGLERKRHECELIYQGRECLITDSSRSWYGVLKKIESNFIYLHPSIVYENFPINKPTEWSYNPRLETEIPTLVPLTPTISFQHLSKGYLEKLVKSYNNWKDHSMNHSIIQNK